jgi:hypothetical protein
VARGTGTPKDRDDGIPSVHSNINQEGKKIEKNRKKREDQKKRDD